MKRDTRNNYALFWRGRYCGEVRGYREALAERHALAERFARACLSRGSVFGGPVKILDTPAVSECCCCAAYCHATISREARK